MSEEKTTNQRPGNRYDTLDSNFVMHAYRRYCEEFGLPFHLLFCTKQEHVNVTGQIDSTIDIFNKIGFLEFDEMQICLDLYIKSLSIFNVLKPEPIPFTGSIASFRFNSTGNYTPHICDSGDFLDEVSNDKFYLGNIEKRFKIVASTLAVVFSILTTSLSILAAKLYCPAIIVEYVHSFNFIQEYILPFGFLIQLYWTYKFIYWLCKRNIEKIRVNELRIKEALDELTSIQTILSTNSLFKDVANKLEASDNIEYAESPEIEQFIRRLKARITNYSSNKDNT